MPIFRGTGGSGDASTNAYASEVATSAQTATTKANEASASAAAAATSATNAAGSEASVSADATTASNAASQSQTCLLYTSPSPRDRQKSRMPSSA